MSKFQLIALAALTVTLLLAGVTEGAVCYALNCKACASGSSILCESSSCKSYFYNLLGACVPCPLHCSSCSNALTCNDGACDSGYEKKYGVCVKSTTDNSSSTSACYNDACLTCEAGSVWKCATNGCKSYYYNLLGACVPCPLHCSSCSNSISCNSGACDSGYNLKNGLCISASASASSRVSIAAAAVTLVALFFAY